MAPPDPPLADDSAVDSLRQQLDAVLAAVGVLAVAIARMAEGEAYVLRHHAAQREIELAYVKADDRKNAARCLEERREIARRWLEDPSYQPPALNWMVYLG